MSHEVCIACDCTDIEQCRTELYVSDVRIMQALFKAWLDELRAHLLTIKGLV